MWVLVAYKKHDFRRILEFHSLHFDCQNYGCSGVWRNILFAFCYIQFDRMNFFFILSQSRPASSKGTVSLFQNEFDSFFVIFFFFEFTSMPVFGVSMQLVFHILCILVSNQCQNDLRNSFIIRSGMEKEEPVSLLLPAFNLKFALRTRFGFHTYWTWTNKEISKFESQATKNYGFPLFIVPIKFRCNIFCGFHFIADFPTEKVGEPEFKNQSENLNHDITLLNFEFPSRKTLD